MSRFHASVRQITLAAITVCLLHNQGEAQSFVNAISADASINQTATANVQNTGIDVGKCSGCPDQVQQVVTWDGSVPGFGWEIGGIAKSLPLLGNSIVAGVLPTDPDVIVGNDGMNAIVVYELNGSILMEVYTRSGNDFLPTSAVPTNVYNTTQSRHPNIAVDAEDNITVIWQSTESASGNEVIYAKAGDIFGTLSPSLAKVSETNFSTIDFNCSEPDVSVFRNDQNYLVQMTFIAKTTGGASSQIIHKWEKFYNVAAGVVNSFLPVTVDNGIATDLLATPRITCLWNWNGADAEKFIEIVYQKTDLNSNKTAILGYNAYTGLINTINSLSGMESCANYKPAVSYCGDNIIVSWSYDDDSPGLGCNLFVPASSYPGQSSSEVVVQVLDFVGVPSGIFFLQNVNLTGAQEQSSVAGRQPVPTAKCYFAHADNQLKRVMYKSSNFSGGALKQAGLQPDAEYSRADQTQPVWPAPADQQVTIDLGSDEELSALKVYDAAGNAIDFARSNWQSDGRLLYLNVSGIPNGLYFVELSTATNTQWQFVTVAH